MIRWEQCLDQAIAKLAANYLLLSFRPTSLSRLVGSSPALPAVDEVQTFDGPQPSDRASVEVDMKDSIFQQWLSDYPSWLSDYGDASGNQDQKELSGKLLLFCSNDYLSLTTHPSVRTAAEKAAREYGMGPKSAALSCGYTEYHRQLEVTLAEMKNKEECILCPTGFAANMAVLSAIGSLSSLTAAGNKPSENEKIAIFSDSLNHGSIFDGIRLAERQQQVVVFVYQHCDMNHLNDLLSSCKIEKKVVITDTSFSMDGDIAPILELVKLRNEYGFLFVVDDAHGTLVFGKNGGGLLEMFGCEHEVDICVGTLSKAMGCMGGFIACSKKWKQLIQSRGRSFIFSTTLPVPIVAAAHAALIVGRKEGWRREALWNKIRAFNSLTGLNFNSPILSLPITNEKLAFRLNWHMLKCGIYVIAVGPPLVPPNTSRVRITLNAAHTMEDLKKLIVELSPFVKFPKYQHEGSIRTPRL